jgi:hypothetical protein
LMRYPTYEEASHFRQGQKNVRFGSAEWKHLLNERSPEREGSPRSHGDCYLFHTFRDSH